MAKRTQVILVDDLDGQEINGNGRTVTFGHGGHAYEIDLTDLNAQKLHDALAPFVAVARQVGDRTSFHAKPDLPAIRLWAKERGIKVSERGRVSRHVQDAYRDAH